MILGLQIPTPALATVSQSSFPSWWRLNNLDPEHLDFFLRTEDHLTWVVLSYFFLWCMFLRRCRRHLPSLGLRTGQNHYTMDQT